MTPPVRSLGFMVWSPEGGMPTVVHSTLARAEAERDRLADTYPDRRFVIMAPIVGHRAQAAVTAFEAGRLAAEAQAHREIMRAEAVSDQALDKIGDLNSELSRLRSAAAFARNAEDYRATVADCQLWFDGFRAAHTLSDVTPKTPDVGKLQRLNSALGDLTAVGRFHATLDEEIPF